MSLGTSLKTSRMAAGITQEQVAKQLFVTRQTVSRWEQDQTLPNINVLKTLSRLYTVPIDELIAQSNLERKEVDQMKHINYIALVGVVFFNLILGTSIWITILGLLLALWVITIALVMAPLIFVGVLVTGIQAFSALQLLACLILFVIGLFLYPAAKKISMLVVDFGKQYIKYNQKALYA